MNFKLALTVSALAWCLLIGSCSKEDDSAKKAPVTEETTAAEPQKQAAVPAVPTVDLKDAATSMAGAFVAQKVDSDAAALLHPRNSVEIVTVVGACDGPPEECTGKKVVVGPEQLEAELEEWFPVAAKVDSCDDKCCTLSTDAKEVGDVHSRLDKLCFATDSGGVVYLEALHRTEGP